MPSERLERIDDVRYRIPRHGRMRTDGLIYASPALLEGASEDGSLSQVINVASLPGIVGASLAMPDFHLGYGFPIGGVAAFDAEKGVVSPGGVGYDINCGVRLLRTDLSQVEVQKHLDALVGALFESIPAGVGQGHRDLHLEKRELGRVLESGVGWAVREGFASEGDDLMVESGGALPDADQGLVSGTAFERGRTQLGTLGSGNHFIEVGYVADVYDAPAARALGLKKGHATVLIHTGSRGLGHQVCDDFIKVMARAARRYGIELPDRQLCCAPVSSTEGRNYLAAMAAAANFAFANRQVITHFVRETFERVFGRKREELGLQLIYDVAHNLAKLENHVVDGRPRRLCVHRKGATRAFPPHHPDLPEALQDLGQPVLIPGDMGRCSYVLLGQEQALLETFGSTCHGAGRLLSRQQALKAARGRSIASELEQQGILVRGASRGTLAEELPEAYKNVDDVVDVVHRAGISRRVVRLRPLGVVKG